MCENCFSKSQNYLKAPPYDLVSAVVTFVISLDITLENYQVIFDIAPEALLTLVEFCAGPNIENQEAVGTRHQLYSLLTFFLSYDATDQDNAKSGFISAIKLLRTLCEGENPKVTNTMVRYLDVSLLGKKATAIY